MASLCFECGRLAVDATLVEVLHGDGSASREKTSEDGVVRVARRRGKKHIHRSWVTSRKRDLETNHLSCRSGLNGQGNFVGGQWWRALQPELLRPPSLTFSVLKTPVRYFFPKKRTSGGLTWKDVSVDGLIETIFPRGRTKEAISFFVLIFISICDGPKFKKMFIVTCATFVVSFIFYHWSTLKKSVMCEL